MSQQHWGALIGGLVGGVFLCWIYHRMHNQVDTLYPDRDCRVCGSDFTDGKRHAHVEVIV